MSTIAYKLLIYNNEKELMGNVTGIKSLQWLEEYADAGDVKLVCAKTKSNVELLKNNVLMHNTDRAHLLARVDSVQYTNSQSEGELITVRAKFTINDWQFRVLLNNNFPSVKNAEQALYHIANKCKRGLNCEIDTPKGFVQQIECEYEKASALTAMVDIASASNLGIQHAVNSNLEEIFTVYSGIDRYSEHSDNYIGYFAVSAGNIDTLEFTDSCEDYCNYAVIQSGDDDENMRTVYVDLSGEEDLKEAYFYASDIKKNYTSENANGDMQSFVRTSAEIDELLYERAVQLLQDKKQTITINAQLKQAALLFGVDYDVGDVLPVVINYPKKMCVAARLIAVKIIYEPGKTIQASLQVSIE